MKPHQLLAATALSGLILMALPAAAQTAQSSSQDTTIGSVEDQTGVRPENTEPDKDARDIVVTGSRLARPALDSQVPITSITSEELLSQGNLNVGDALNDLPQLRSTYSQANSTRFIGTSGLNILDLRGLGTSRTLVLVNGRRHVTSVPGTSLVDTNTIPTDLLDRVDIVTGGNSAIYGSDAIAGVVNFVLKQDFEGLKLNGQGGVSQQGDRMMPYVSAVYGRNFDEGRGNIAVAAEYSHSSAVYYNDRDYETGAYSGRHQYNLSEPVAGEPASGDGIIDYLFYDGGIRNGSYSTGGMLNAVCNTTALLSNAARCRQNSLYASTYGASTTYVGQRYAFDSTGNLVLSNPAIDFRDTTAGGSTNTLGGLGATLYETGQLIPRQDRVSLNFLGHYDYSDALTVYVEGKYVKINVDQEGQPSFGSYSIRCNNPYVSATSLATLQSIGYCATPSTGSFTINRFNTDFGGRGELQERQLFRLVSGIRGTFNDDWKYDVSATYGQYTARLTSLNNLVTARMANALNAVRNSAGQIVCSINADASTTNDDPACVPINILGYGSPSAAALAYVNTTAHRKSYSSQVDITGYLSGDLSQLFELPGGPIGFVFGGEYRRERSYQLWDPFTAAGNTFLNAIQPFLPPNLEVKEAFTEVNVPLLKDIPVFRELTLSGAARVSDYNTSTGTVWAYSGGAVWAPIRDVRIRGNYSRSVRAPTMSDLYTTPSQNYASVQDPCDVLYINNGQYRAANCAAAGVPTNFMNTVARTQTISYLSGGNPNLKAETSDSYTIGAVWEPRSLVPGMSVTVDYYNITVKNLIATLSAQTILNQCYDSPSGIANQYCALVTRNADGTFATNGILSAGVNYARQKTSGIDMNLAYAHTFDNGDKMGLSLNVAWVAERTNYTNPADPNYADRQLSEMGDPQWEMGARASYTRGPVSLSYQFQYIGPMITNEAAYETLYSYDGRAATNADAYARYWTPAYTYHNVRVGLNVSDKYEMYFGVDNLFNTYPPDGLFGNDAYSSIYDAVGRYFYAGFKLNL